MAASDKGQGQVAYVYLVQYFVNAGIAVNLVEIIDGNIVLWAFILKNIFFTENGGDVLFDGSVLGFLDYHHVNLQRLGSKLVL